MNWPAYPQYKPSGIAWLGDVPEHWEVKRLKWSVSGVVNGSWGDDPNGIDDIVCVRVADFDRERFRVCDAPPTLRSIDSDQRRSRALRRGDLLIEKSGGGEKQLVGAVVLFDHEFEAVCSNFIARVRSKPGMDGRFWVYVHSAIYAGRLNLPSIKQTTGIQNLDTSAYFDEQAAFPPYNEQSGIAEFLDAQTAKIDTLLAKKRELVEKLQERRTALISRTVTRGLPPEAARAAGLDPCPKLKPSGIEWLGDVPEHWNVKRGRFCFLVNPTSGRWQELVESEEVSFVPMEAVCEYGGLILGISKPLSEIGPGYTAFQDGDVVVAKITPCFENWKGALADGLTNKVGFGTTELHVLRVMGALDRRFLFYITVSLPYRKSGEAGMYGAGGQKRVPTEFNKDFRTPIPPLLEQRTIADYLDRETSKLDRLATKVEAAVERLREYRAALITAAVTGKIDVRGWSAAGKPA